MMCLQMSELSQENNGVPEGEEEEQGAGEAKVSTATQQNGKNTCKIVVSEFCHRMTSGTVCKIVITAL